MYLPDYHGGSIVNLMSSIAKACGGKNPYPQLRNLSSDEIKKSKNIILLVIDGLGYEYLRNSNAKFLKMNMKDKMTSVFLPTTACATTTFQTGVAPQQHALTGWFMFLKEVGMITSILPFTARIGGEVISQSGIEIEKIFEETAFTKKIKRKSVTLIPDFLLNSDFTKHVSENSKMIPFTNLDNLFLKMKKAINNISGKKYIFAYWPNFDHFAHENGVGSEKVEKHLMKLDKKIKSLVQSIKNSNTTMIITADHGLLDIPKNRIIKLEDHPKLKECLTMSPCGEGRVAYLYVKPTKIKEFKKYIKDKLGNYCDLYKSSEIIKKEYFGLGKPNPRLIDRIGDYILIMRENYLFKDEIEKNPHRFIGHHGGVSKEEMLVPLIVIKA